MTANSKPEIDVGGCGERQYAT